MRFAKRLDLVPPYLFAELERKIEEKRREGVVNKRPTYAGFSWS
jgi:hypothetical protein